MIPLDKIHFEIRPHEEVTPVRGNAASGDDAQDKQIEDSIFERLDNGDIWAWCCVEVRGTIAGLSASVWLGGCSCSSRLVRAMGRVETGIGRLTPCFTATTHPAAPAPAGSKEHRLTCWIVLTMAEKRLTATPWFLGSNSCYPMNTFSTWQCPARQRAPKAFPNGEK